MHCPPEIAYLHCIEVEENILWLDVSVDYLLFVDIVQSFTDLSDDRASVCLLHPMALPQQLKKLPSSTVLNQQIDILLVLEVSI